MDIQQFQQNLEHLNTLHKHHKYDEALKLVQEMMTEYPYSVELLVKRAKLIQLLEVEDNFSEVTDLDLAVYSLDLAHLLAPNAIEPCLELGYFKYAIKDAPEQAITYFDVAQKNAELGLKEALIGQIKCYIDLGDISQARSSLEKAKVFFPDESNWEIFEFELEEFDLEESPRS